MSLVNAGESSDHFPLTIPYPAPKEHTWVYQVPQLSQIGWFLLEGIAELATIQPANAGLSLQTGHFMFDQKYNQLPFLQPAEQNGHLFWHFGSNRA